MTAPTFLSRAVIGRPIPPSTLPTIHASDPSARTPARCHHCGSRMIEVDRPLSHHDVGAVTCLACSRQLCWVLP